MAKQTFTVGQVLTAAQMTSLQQTAMGGGSATAKTASYVLVAADAGTVVQMNSASATTITVNTALFAAGDTVQIQNVGSGVCTVTAGSATVSTAGSLALSQYEGGQLYFNTTSAALFVDIVQSSGMTNPMTTTGDIIYSSSGSTPARLGIGTTGQVLNVSGGIPAWTTAASGSALTLISRTTFSGVASQTFDGVFTSTYENYIVYFNSMSAATSADDPQLALRYEATDVASSVYFNRMAMQSASGTVTGSGQNAVSFILMNAQTGSGSEPGYGAMYFGNVGNTANKGNAYGWFNDGQSGNMSWLNGNFASGNAANKITTGFKISTSSSNVSGTITIYGLAKA